MAVKYDFSITFQTRSGYYSTDKAELRRLREAVDLRNYRNEIRETLGRMLPERGPGQRPVEVIDDGVRKTTLSFTVEHSLEDEYIRDVMAGIEARVSELLLDDARMREILLYDMDRNMYRVRFLRQPERMYALVEVREGLVDIELIDLSAAHRDFEPNESIREESWFERINRIPVYNMQLTLDEFETSFGDDLRSRNSGDEEILYSVLLNTRRSYRREGISYIAGNYNFDHLYAEDSAYPNYDDFVRIYSVRRLQQARKNKILMQIADALYVRALNKLGSSLKVGDRH